MRLFSPTATNQNIFKWNFIGHKSNLGKNRENNHEELSWKRSCIWVMWTQRQAHMKMATALPGYVLAFPFEITYRKLTTSISTSQNFLVKRCMSCSTQGFPNGFSSTPYVTRCITNTHTVSNSILSPKNLFR